MAVAFFSGLACTAWAAAYAWGKWLTHRHDGQKRAAPPPAVDMDRIARLEQAIETLAVELERIGEGQRYAARILDERLPQRLPAGRPGEGKGIVTPH
jgi:hypothetical protein